MNDLRIPNVNPGLINPKRLFNWEATIYVPSKVTITGGYPLINKQCFINPGLTLIYVLYAWWFGT